MSHVTLVRPPSVVTRGQISLPTCPPLGLAYLAATLKQEGHGVEVVDSLGESVFQFTPFNHYISYLGLTFDQVVDRIPSQTDLIGVSVMFSQEWPTTRLLIQKIRSRFPNCPIVVGGEHVNALPEYVLRESPEIDFCVLGEGEETLSELTSSLGSDRQIEQVKGIAYRRDQKIVKTGTRSRMRELDEIPPPAWEFFPIHNYLDNGLCTGAYRGRSMPIIATRGCPFECTFCSNPAMWTQRWITRDPALVIAEMKELVSRYGVENFEFCDLTAIVRKDWTVRFATMLIASQMNVYWQFPSGTRSEAIDSEVCDLLQRSGCKNLVYAPESGSPTTLKMIKKQVHLERMKESIQSAIRVGINVRVNFVIGFPGEGHKQILESFKFLLSLAWLGAHDITHFIFAPYPGSELFQKLREVGRIPELTDEYFIGLLCYTDMKRTISYDDKIQSWQLAAYRVTALLFFYFFMFLFRPWRILRILANVFKEKQESRMEMALKNILIRRRTAGSMLAR